MSDVVLQINGVAYRGWKAFTVRRSVKMITDSFDVTLTEKWPGNDIGWPISPDDAFDLLIDGERVMSGYVDDVAFAYDASSNSVTIKGRSKLRDLIDCSGIHAPWEKQTLKQLASIVCGLFGLTVEIAAGVTGIDAPFTKAVIEPGETYMEFLKRLADERGVILTDTHEGNLLITRAGTDKAPTALILGENILSGSATYSVRDRFYKYLVIGQSGAILGNTSEDATKVDAVVLDNAIRKARTKVIDPDDSVTLADVKRYGERERNTRYGESLTATYTVSGHRHRDGLWQPNTLVYIDDPRARIKGDRLIIDVEYSRDKASTTSITVMPPEALDIIPLPQADTDEWIRQDAAS